MNEAEVNIRSCRTIQEFEQMVDLQLRVWGWSEREIVPSRTFVVAVESGGQVMGAFAREQMVGFALAFSGIRDTVPFLHSNMVAVLEPFRDTGIGKKLKLAQRADALHRGIHLIEWTFDPLETRNAYLNVCRLGVIIRRYLPDLYGPTSAVKYRGLPTDRLVAEWQLNSDRVAQILCGNRPSLSEKTEVIPVHNSQTFSIQLVAEIQQRSREKFQRLFAAGYAVKWLERDSEGVKYILEIE